MRQIQNIDVVLIILYNHRAINGLIDITDQIKTSGVYISSYDLEEIKERLYTTRFAVLTHQSDKSRVLGAISQAGIDFLLSNSFTQPGTSALELKRKLVF